MATTGVDATSTTNTAEDFYYTTQVKKANNELDKTAFLKLLVTQLRYQDPLSPSQDTEFAAQLAQFSALEAMTNLQTSYQQSQAYGMIGLGVYGTVRDDRGIPVEVIGTVESAGMKDGKVYVVVDGVLMYMDDVLQVFDGEALNGPNGLVAGMSLVGQYVVARRTSQVEDEYGDILLEIETIEGVVERLVVKNGQVYLQIGDKEVALYEIVSVGGPRAEDDVTGDGETE